MCQKKKNHKWKDAYFFLKKQIKKKTHINWWCLLEHTGDNLEGKRKKSKWIKEAELCLNVGKEFRNGRGMETEVSNQTDYSWMSNSELK